MNSGYLKRKLSEFLSIGLIYLIGLAPAGAFSQQHRILLDGAGDDWQVLEPSHSDPLHDQKTGNLDFHRLWIAHDEDYIFFRLEIGAEINLQEENSLVLYLDTDDNAATGKPILGLGAELEWRFGDRAGDYFSGNNKIAVTHGNIGLVTAPTVSASDFEMALSRRAKLKSGQPLFPGPRVLFAFEDRGPGQDRLPDRQGGVGFDLAGADSLEKLPTLPLGRQDPGQVRFLTYNVLRDNLFKDQAMPSFQRILRALQPDIIGFQEIYSHNAQETVALIEKMLPLTDPQRWHGAKIGRDLIVISKYLITQTYSIPGANILRANGAFLLDLQPTWPTPLLFIVAHPPCCSDNAGRQTEIDAIMAFIRNAQAGKGALHLPRLTPILIVGDMNLVGYAQQLQTFLTGAIKNQEQFGDSFQPDWDGTDFADLSPRHVQTPMFFTWYETTSSYSPGRLDFMIYSDSVLKPGNRFVLFTPDLSPDSLRKYQLQVQDALQASDHLPIVADFSLNFSGQSQTEATVPSLFVLGQNYPNPFSHTTVINYEIQAPTHVVLVVVNALGQEVRQLVDSTQTAGSYLSRWDGRDNQGRKTSPGVYFCVLKTGAHTLVQKLLYLR